MPCEHSAILYRGQLCCRYCRAVFKILPGENRWIAPLTYSERGQRGGRPRKEAP